MWHRIGIAEEHRVHMRNFQAHHAPVVEWRLDSLGVHGKRDALEEVLTQLYDKLVEVAPIIALCREAP